MFRALLAAFICLAVLTTAAVAIDQPVRPTPLMREVTPSPATMGQEVVAAGRYLNQNFVAAVYLTPGENMYQAGIKTQSDRSFSDRFHTGGAKCRPFTTFFSL